MKLSRLNSEAGSTLIMVLLLTMVILILGLTLGNTSISQYRTVINEEKKMQAYYIAKSGANMIASAIQNETVDPADLAGRESSTVNLNNGSFVVNVDYDGTIVSITSTGTTGDVSQEVAVDLVKTVGEFELPSLNHAVAADGQVTVGGNTNIKGSIATNENGTDENGNTKVAIKVDNENADIDGSVYTGPDPTAGAVDLPKDDYDGITGEIGELPHEIEYPLPEYPEFPGNIPYTPGTYAVRENNSDPHTIDSSGWYDKLEVTKTLTIKVRDEDLTIRINKLVIQGKGKVIIDKPDDAEGKLNLYVEDEITINGQASFNENGDPDDVYMYYSGNNELNFSGNTVFAASAYIEKANIRFSGNGGITGNITSGGGSIDITGNGEAFVRAIYAPESHISIEGNGFVNGAIVGKTVNVKGSDHSGVEYNEDISDIDPEDLGFEEVLGYKRTWK